MLYRMRLGSQSPERGSNPGDQLPRSSLLVDRQPAAASCCQRTSGVGLRQASADRLPDVRHVVAAVLYALYTHDSWGQVKVAEFPTEAEARQAFGTLCQDPWYRQDGTVRGLELVRISADGEGHRLDWFAFV